jgi:hypothetical protein
MKQGQAALIEVVKSSRAYNSRYRERVLYTKPKLGSPVSDNDGLASRMRAAWEGPCGGSEETTYVSFHWHMSRLALDVCGERGAPVCPRGVCQNNVVVCWLRSRTCRLCTRGDSDGLRWTRGCLLYHSLVQNTIRADA